MLFALTWVPHGDQSEERDKRMLKLFTSWTPPKGVEFKGFYDYADCHGGVAIIEASSSEVILEATAPWAAYLAFQMRPIVPSDKAAAIFQKTQAWRDGIK